jgi:CheY-like chemotaxis protein
LDRTLPTTCTAGIGQRDGPGVISALDRAPFDVLVSDIAMPGDDGYDLIRKVRAREAGRGGQLVASGVIRVPIAATYRLTAFREAVAHVQRGGKVMFDVDGAI